MQDQIFRRKARALVGAAEQVLRAGGVCRVEGGDGALLVRALDTVSEEELGGWLGRPEPPLLVITGNRAKALGLDVAEAANWTIGLPRGFALADLVNIAGVSGIGMQRGLLAACTFTQGGEIENAALDLAKRAALLPAVLALPAGDEPGEIVVSAEKILAQAADDLATLRPVVETALPVAAADRARLVLFRSASGTGQHAALIVGDPSSQAAPLCRLHSECLTGDVFGSLRCDCGEQLHAALEQMSAEGGGILLYMRQEGRGIGLVNKLRAYRLQSAGLDTVDANTHLGFEPDERDFAFAAAMLRQLRASRVRLLTNNPAKLESLGRHGIEISERLPLAMHANSHNQAYLLTKALRSGHLLRAV